MSKTDPAQKEIQPFTKNIYQFTILGGLHLRNYQKKVARAVVRSVVQGKGESIVVMFPRQSGKNELQAQLEAFFLLRYSSSGGELVKISPTWKPQSQNAQRRLQHVLEKHPLLKDKWHKEQGYIYRVGAARQIFLSGSPESNIVGATASLLLQVDEAQDIRIDKFDKEIAPMAASTNATRVFWGTAWRDDTLLARELQAARESQKRDGIQRTFVLNADQVAKEVPAYGLFVRQQIERLGRDHPMVRTQFFSEVLQQGGGLFHEGRLALLQGDHSQQSQPQANQIYALLLDVAGEDEGLSQNGELSSPERDFSALTIVQISHAAAFRGAPLLASYAVVFRKSWQGIPQSQLFNEVLALAKLWRVRKLVVDATGIGAGLANFLQRALPGRVIPILFTASSKSQLGWNFLALIDSGRFKDHIESSPQQKQFFTEARACQYAVSPGPEQRLSWSVPPGSRDGNGQLIHDDWLISVALAAALENETLVAFSPTHIISAADPLHEMDSSYEPKT